MIFWTVSKIKQFFQDIFSITEITQNWNGNKPIFIKIPRKIRDTINWFKILIFLNVNQITDLKIIIEETLCTKKYITMDFSDLFSKFIEISGIKENKLISIAIHKIKNLFDESPRKTLIIIEKKKIKFWWLNEFFIS